MRRGENRRSAWIWTAAVEEWDGSRWADFEVGYRDAETFLRLFRRLPDAAKYRSDHYEAYSHPPPARHVKGKGSEVNRNAGLRAKLRVRLNRLVRRTHGYASGCTCWLGRLRWRGSGTVYINASACKGYLQRLVRAFRSEGAWRTVNLKEADAFQRLVCLTSGFVTPALSVPQRNRRLSASGMAVNARGDSWARTSLKEADAFQRLVWNRGEAVCREGQEASKKQTPFSVWYAAPFPEPPAREPCLKEADAFQRLV